MFKSNIDVSGKTYWLLGDNFLRGWYSIFDHIAFKFGFVPLVGSLKLAPATAAVMGG